MERVVAAVAVAAVAVVVVVVLAVVALGDRKCQITEVRDINDS